LRASTERVFVEVPDAAYDLTTARLGLHLPPRGYFGRSSLEALAARTGWQVAEIGNAFHDQYLWAVLEQRGLRFDAATSHWQSTLEGRRAVVWGAGTRGTMFCNRVDPDATLILGVVDRNPAKHSRYLPITGHRVLAPTSLVELAPTPSSSPIPRTSRRSRRSLPRWACGPRCLSPESVCLKGFDVLGGAVSRQRHARRR
jgi:hypothetical protein